MHRRSRHSEGTTYSSTTGFIGLPLPPYVDSVLVFCLYMYRTYSPKYQNIFTDVQKTKKICTKPAKPGEAGTPDINTGEAGIGHKKFNATAKPVNAPANPAFRRSNLY